MLSFIVVYLTVSVLLPSPSASLVDTAAPDDNRKWFIFVFVLKERHNTSYIQKRKLIAMIGVINTSVLLGMSHPFKIYNEKSCIH